MNGQETPARICQNSLSDVGGGGLVHVEVVVVEMVNMMVAVGDEMAMFVLSLVDLIFSALVLNFHENEDPSFKCVFLVHAEPIAQNPN